MKLIYKCDFCGRSFERGSSHTKGRKHIFCSRQCAGAFESKKQNPDHYADGRDFTKAAEVFRRCALRDNPMKMTPEMREKLHNARCGNGNARTYSKYYGRHEHRVVAERMLGRALLPGEIVHHRDGNKRNNTPENLIIFNSQSEHAKHHAELRWFLNELEKIEGGDAE